MSETAIRAQIKIILEGISGIGVVHDRERYSRSLADFLKFMTHDGKVNGWTIGPCSISDSRRIDSLVECTRDYPISGIMELDDELNSQATAQALCELIRTTFNRNIKLNDTAVRCDPLLYDLDYSIPGEYGQKIYHTVEAMLKVQDRDYS